MNPSPAKNPAMEMSKQIWPEPPIDRLNSDTLTPSANSSIFPPRMLRASFEAYYDDASKDYWVKNECGDYMRVNESSLKRMLKKAGYNPTAGKYDPMAEVDEEVVKIQMEKRICYAGPLAGHALGAHKIEGRTVLVTDSPKLVEPVPGEWPLLSQVIQQMFNSGDDDQAIYLYGWLQFALECLRSGQHHPGQALVMAGERECGKSLMQGLITELLGGRSAKPYQFMTDGTAFNSDLFGAEHLMVEDEAASTDLRARRHFGAYLKQITAADTQRLHGKNRNALTLTRSEEHT